MFYKKQELITTCRGGHLLLVTPQIHSLSFSTSHKLSFFFPLLSAPTIFLWFFHSAPKIDAGDFCFRKVPLSPPQKPLGPFGLWDHGAAVPRRLHPNYSLIIFPVLRPESPPTVPPPSPPGVRLGWSSSQSLLWSPVGRICLACLSPPRIL